MGKCHWRERGLSNDVLFCDRNFPNLIFLFNFDKFVLIYILNKMVFKLSISRFCQLIMASPFLPCEDTSLCAWVLTPARRPQFTQIVPIPLCLLTWPFLWQMAQWRAKIYTLDTSPENPSLMWDKVTWSSERTSVMLSRASFNTSHPYSSA